MPRFSVGFNRRRSAATADDLQNVQMTAPEQSSFRVIERTDLPSGKTFDGGARLARAAGHTLPRPNTMVDLSAEDNMFADLKGNRGSGASNTTKATSTDTSSRHSNASTTPSSADLGANGSDEHRSGKKPLHDVGSRAAPKSSPSGFLSRAGRTFSFGGQKKNSVPPPANNEPIPDVPPIPSIQREDVQGRTRGMTASTASTATPPKLESSTKLDLGGDFGSMFSGFDKRASMATLKSDPAAARLVAGSRPTPPAPLNLDHKTAVEPSPHSWNSQTSNDNLLGSNAIPRSNRQLPPVPAHTSPALAKSPPLTPAPAPADDEDARLLQDSLAATKFLSHDREKDTLPPLNRKAMNSNINNDDDNMFSGTTSQFSRISGRRTTQASGSGQNKVMTPAEFERYRKDKERQKSNEPNGKAPVADDDDEDEINYDDDDDEIEKSKQQAKQRRKQEAHMAVYRQQMMKVTGERPPSPPPASYRPGLTPSMSAPALNQLKTPSPDPTRISDEDDDEEVPLAILQAHGFPNRNRPPTRLSTVGSNPNLRASMAVPSSGRPGSALGEVPPAQRHSTLPAFARNLPQDPFVGASIARPAVRESLAMGGGSPAIQQGQTHAPLPPGGLVGVIASEERSRALRRGSPNMETQRMSNAGMLGMQGPGFDPIAGIPHQMMYSTPQPTLTPGDQAQIQMTQQMQQFMQMQMQMMQMMAFNQNGVPPGMPPQPYSMPMGIPSVADMNSRQSVMGDQMLAEPRRMDAGMRTMSMIQPNTSSFIQQPGYAGSIRGSVMPGYTPSIAPSERSNIGLPGRYRPVSQLPVQAPVQQQQQQQQHQRANTMSGALSMSRWDENKSKPTIKIVGKSGDDSDDDDEEGWEAMKAKREKKKSSWKTKKVFGTDLSSMIT
ncbi:hypothetical protein S40293_00337 [Stachybotrys chartarum IBT 40293]|nr:hypothetical protein S40293_00337 [Stachybotrys chartarum IBT 40293]